MLTTKVTKSTKLRISEVMVSKRFVCFVMRESSLNRHRNLSRPMKIARKPKTFSR